MRAICVLACLLLLSGRAAGESKEAERLYKQGRKAERAGDIVRAYLLYAEAAALDPSGSEYWLRSKTLRAHAVELAKRDPRWPGLPEGREAVPEEVPGEEKVALGITDAELAEARQPQPPMALRTSEARKDLDFRGNTKTLFEQVASAYGLAAVFDWEYPPGPSFRFQLDGADYREALRALQAATDSFVVPLGDKLFLVATDTPQKRADLEPVISVTVPVPEPVSLQDAQELVRAVQQTMNLLRFALDSQRRIVLMRDRISKVRPALVLFEQLLRHRAQVYVSVELVEASQAGTTSYGLSLQTLFPLVYLGDFWNSTPVIPSGFTRFAAFGGGATLFGIGVADAGAFARMNRSNIRTLLKTEIRSLDGQAASIHFGERFPILTGAFLGQVQGEQSSFPPAFNFEDLGLVLKVTPHVHGTEEVSLDLEAEFKVLTGEGLNGIPVIANRQLQSSVRLRENEWAVVAGLMSASETRAITGPAGLSRLPFLGALLRENDRSSELRNVYLVLKPTILNPPPAGVQQQAVWVGPEARPPSPL